MDMIFGSGRKSAGGTRRNLIILREAREHESHDKHTPKIVQVEALLMAMSRHGWLVGSPGRRGYDLYVADSTRGWMGPKL